MSLMIDVAHQLRRRQDERVLAAIAAHVQGPTPARLPIRLWADHDYFRLRVELFNVTLAVVEDVEIARASTAGQAVALVASRARAGWWAYEPEIPDNVVLGSE